MKSFPYCHKQFTELFVTVTSSLAANMPPRCRFFCGNRSRCLAGNYSLHLLQTKNAPHSSFYDGICVSRQIKCRDFGSAKTTQSRLLYPTLYKLYYSQIYIVFLPRTPSYSFCLLRRDLGCRGLSPANPLPGFAGFGGKDK